MELSDLIIYWRIIRKRLWLILILVATTVAAIVGFSLTKPPLYRASARVQVIAAPPTDVSLYQSFKGGSFSEEIALTRASFMEVVGSLENAWQVVNELELPMRGKELLDKVSVEEFAISSSVRVYATSDDPQMAADVANAVVEVGLQRYGELNAHPLTLRREFITSQLDETREDLQLAQTELIRFQIENRIATLEDSIKTLQDLIRDLELAHDSALALGNDEQAATYSGLIDARLRELQNVVQLNSQYDTLSSRVNQLRDTYDYLLTKETEARLKENEALNLAFIQVLGQAQPPSVPESRLSFSLLALGIVIAGILGVMISFLWEYVEEMQSPETSAMPFEV